MKTKQKIIETRKQNFNRKSTSEQNIHNLRRQFNLGNVETELQQELQEVMNNEDILEMMNQEQTELKNNKSQCKPILTPIYLIFKVKTITIIKIFMINQLLQCLDHYHQSLEAVFIGCGIPPFVC